MCGGAYSNPQQKYTDAKTVQLRAPMRPNPRAPIRNQGLPCVETFVATTLETFSQELEVLLSVMCAGFNPQRSNKLDS